MSNFEDIQIEIARTLRECTQQVERRLRDRQLGEAWVDLPSCMILVDDRGMDEGEQKRAA